MTQESPVRLCYECRTPLGHKPDRVAGELYCPECAPTAMLRQRL
jgi:uncharacterized Zn finger protein (UPF0148 family)